jgi:hypothetical protein
MYSGSLLFHSPSPPFDIFSLLSPSRHFSIKSRSCSPMVASSPVPSRLPPTLPPPSSWGGDRRGVSPFHNYKWQIKQFDGTLLSSLFVCMCLAVEQMRLGMLATCPLPSFTKLVPATLRSSPPCAWAGCWLHMHVKSKGQTNGYGPAVNHLKHLWTQKSTFRVDGPNWNSC